MIIPARPYCEPDYNMFTVALAGLLSSSLPLEFPWYERTQVSCGLRNSIAPEGTYFHTLCRPELGNFCVYCRKIHRSFTGIANFTLACPACSAEKTPRLEAYILLGKLCRLPDFAQYNLMKLLLAYDTKRNMESLAGGSEDTHRSN